MVEAAVCSQAMFAKMHRVSRQSVSRWKARGYLVLQGDAVLVEASNARLAAAGKSRLPPVTQGGNQGADSADKVTLRETASSLSSVIDGSAGDIALALLTVLSMETVRPLVEGIVAQMRIGAVEILNDEAPPPGLSSWAEHEWFTRPPLTEDEWREVPEELRRYGPPSAPIPWLSTAA
jgi:hypothetical protein